MMPYRSLVHLDATGRMSEVRKLTIRQVSEKQTYTDCLYWGVSTFQTTGIVVTTSDVWKRPYQGGLM